MGLNVLKFNVGFTREIYHTAKFFLEFIALVHPPLAHDTEPTNEILFCYLPPIKFLKKHNFDYALIVGLGVNIDDALMKMTQNIQRTQKLCVAVLISRMLGISDRVSIAWCSCQEGRGGGVHERAPCFWPKIC
jgi:hypothetical protein